MRRPRSKLQVSTFPFLAVLLCAMGALLLLLFIMDRRAKMAAQYTIAEAVAERKKRSQEEEDARQAEWERARALLHQSLLEQQGEVLGDVKGVQQGVTEAEYKLALTQAQHGDLDGKIKAEATQIAVLQLQIANRNVNLKDSDKKDAKSKAELLDAAKDLADLEQAFRRLKALRERDKETYSVVPYRGKRGDLRPPIYVECVRGGVIFHPEKKALQYWDFTPDAMRTEVERRTGRLALDKTVKDKGREIVETHKVPYVLFLVRPDGIGSYYKAQDGLKGYQLDFGYELVDEYWVLDFTGDPNVPQLPSTLAKTGDPQTPNFRPSSPFIGGSGPGQGSSASGSFGNSGTRPGGIVGGTPGGTGTGPGGIGFGPGIGNAGTPGAPPYGYGNPAYRGIDTGIPVKGPAFVPISRQQQSIPIASSGYGDPSLPFSGSASPTPRSDLIAPLGVPAGSPGGAGPNAGYPSSGTAGTYRVGSGIPPGANGDGGSLPPIAMLTPGSNVGGRPPGSLGSLGQGGQPGGSPGAPGQGGQPGGSPGSPGQGGQPGGSPGQGGQPGGSPGSPGQGGQPGGSPGQGGQPGGSPTEGGQSEGAPTSQGQGGQPGGSQGLRGESGQGQDQGGDDPIPAPRLPGFGPQASKKPPSPVAALSRMIGNKDFVIIISCYAEHVTVSPSGLQYRWDKGNAAANDQALVQTVTNLIARRQASVRPDEPPYRPIIRFEVPADGYPTYYRAYPLLEHLRVPMTKENTRD